jgi:GntR family transcriptional regulator, transcriptional repressor for pyruvate dehydrogenase complex
MPIVSRALTLSVTADDRSVDQLFEIRQALEALAARRAADCRTEAEAAAIVDMAIMTGTASDDIVASDEADNRFLEFIGEVAGNQYVNAVLIAIRHMHGDVARLVSQRVPGAVAIAAKQHVRIAEAIAAGDAEEAAEAMATHVKYAATALRGIL